MWEKERKRIQMGDPTPAVIAAPFRAVILLDPKSASFATISVVCGSRLTMSTFAVLMSRWMTEFMWRKHTPFAAFSAMRSLSRLSFTFCFFNSSASEPNGTNSVTMAKWPGVTIAPRNVTMSERVNREQEMVMMGAKYKKRTRTANLLEQLDLAPKVCGSKPSLHQGRAHLFHGNVDSAPARTIHGAVRALATL